MRDLRLSIVSLAVFVCSEITTGFIRQPSGSQSSSSNGRQRKLIPAFLQDKLSRALLEDLLPPISSQCDAVKSPGSYTTKFNFTFSDSNATSEWDAGIVPGAEQKVFLLEMSHSSSKKSQAWKLRLGKGGNIYSFVGPYGEAIPPQSRQDSPWVDEVWQSVSINTALNGANGYPFFIHQAGTYDNDNLPVPYYSPTLAVYCSEEHHSCSVASWGQQAHIPTKYESTIMYINRYTNCNKGLLEITSMIHNFGDTLNPRLQTSIDYLNVPWAGVRASSLGEMLVSSPPSAVSTATIANRNAQLQALEPIPLFANNAAVSTPIESTGGYVVFAQDHVHDDEIAFSMPCGSPNQSYATPCFWTGAEKVRLVMDRDNACEESPRHTQLFDTRVMFCYIRQTMEVQDSCAPCAYKFINANTGSHVLVSGVIHWSLVGNRIYFMVDNSVTVDYVNSVFGQGDQVTVQRYNGGVSYDEALALAFVYGTDVNNHLNLPTKLVRKAFLRFGRGGSFSRDFIVFVVIVRATIAAGQTYVKRHYVVSDILTGLSADRLNSLSGEVYQTVLERKYSPGREISLYSTKTSKWFTVATDDYERAACDKLPSIQKVCQGWTTPQENTRKLVYIRCGNEYYMGENFYHFQENDLADGHLRPYICDDAEEAEPEILFLGFFNPGDCDDLVESKLQTDLCIPVVIPPVNNTVDNSTVVPVDNSTVVPVDNSTVVPGNPTNSTNNSTQVGQNNTEPPSFEEWWSQYYGEFNFSSMEQDDDFVLIFPPGFWGGTNGSIPDSEYGYGYYPPDNGQQGEGTTPLGTNPVYPPDGSGGLYYPPDSSTLYYPENPSTTDSQTNPFGSSNPYPSDGGGLYYPPDSSELYYPGSTVSADEPMPQFADRDSGSYPFGTSDLYYPDMNRNRNRASSMQNSRTAEPYSSASNFSPCSWLMILLMTTLAFIL